MSGVNACLLFILNVDRVVAVREVRTFHIISIVVSNVVLHYLRPIEHNYVLVVGAFDF